MPLVDRNSTEPQTELHLMSESGIIDSVVLLGPSPQQLFSQYGQLTGLSFKISLHTLQNKLKNRILMNIFHVFSFSLNGKFERNVK